MAELLAHAEKRNLVDTHCHLDFMNRRFTGARPASFREFREEFDDSFPASFEGCIAVFCQPQEWKRVGDTTQSL